MNGFKIDYREIKSYIGVTFIAICAFKILMTLHLPNVDELTNVSFAIKNGGEDYWFYWQNRFLGPYSISGISNIFGVSFKSAWYIYHAITLQIFCVLIFWILRHEGFFQKDAFAYLVGILFAFLTLQHFWFFAWDSIDLIVFTCFAYGIAKSYSILFFLIIFLIGMPNRESALFIAVYLMLDAFKFTKGGLPVKLANCKSLIIGFGMLISGIFFTQFIRNLLFVSKPDDVLLGNQIYIFVNFKNLFFSNFTNLSEVFFTPITSHNFIVSIFLLTSFGYFLSNYKSMYDQQLKLLIMSVIIFANILIFGILNETRLYFILLPLHLFLWLSLKGKILASTTNAVNQY